MSIKLEISGLQLPRWVAWIRRNTHIEKDYLNDLKQIKETIRTSQNKAMVVVNSAMIITYYDIFII